MCDDSGRLFVASLYILLPRGIYNIDILFTTKYQWLFWAETFKPNFGKM